MPMMHVRGLQNDIGPSRERPNILQVEDDEFSRTRMPTKTKTTHSQSRQISWPKYEHPTS